MRERLSRLSSYLGMSRRLRLGYEYSGNPTRLVILHDGDNPTLGYFGASIEAVFSGLPVVRVNIYEKPIDVQLTSGDVVVIIRYLNDVWRNTLQVKSSDLAGLIYFMDDDLLDYRAIIGLPRNYMRKLKKRALHHRWWLEQYCSEFWVGAKALAEKYADYAPKLLNPIPPKFNTSNTLPIYVAYHGSASHGTEIMWLYDVISQILQQDCNVHVEIFGDLNINRLYRDLPRVSVIQAMSWPNYLAYMYARRIDIFLVPLMDNPFNIGRSYTKFFDAARAGAVGLYTRAPPYKDFVRDGVDGILLENDIDVWVSAVLELAGDPIRRQALANNCIGRSQAMMVSDNIYLT